MSTVEENGLGTLNPNGTEGYVKYSRLSRNLGTVGLNS